MSGQPISTVVATGRLAECEAAIERGRVGIIEAASGLRTIRDERLYREAGYKSFDTYCQERFHFTRARADQIIAAGATAEKLPTHVGTSLTEAQAREIAPVADDPQAVAEVMAESSSNGHSSARAIKAAVAKRAPKLPKCPECGTPADPAKRTTTDVEGVAWHDKCLSVVFCAHCDFPLSSPKDDPIVWHGGGGLRHERCVDPSPATGEAMAAESEDAEHEPPSPELTPEPVAEATDDASPVELAGEEAAAPGTPAVLVDAEVRIVGGEMLTLRVTVTREQVAKWGGIPDAIGAAIVTELLENRPPLSLPRQKKGKA